MIRSYSSFSKRLLALLLAFFTLSSVLVYGVRASELEENVNSEVESEFTTTSSVESIDKFNAETGELTTNQTTIQNIDESGATPTILETTSTKEQNFSNSVQINFDLFPLFLPRRGQQTLRAKNGMLLLPYYLRLKANGNNSSSWSGIDFNTEYIELIGNLNSDIQVQNGLLKWNQGAFKELKLVVALPIDWQKRYAPIFTTDNQEYVADYRLWDKPSLTSWHISPAFKINSKEDFELQQEISVLAENNLRLWREGEFLPSFNYQLDANSDSGLEVSKSIPSSEDISKLPVEIYPVLADGKEVKLQRSNQVSLKPYILRFTVEDSVYSLVRGIDFGTTEVEIISGASQDINIKDGKLLWEKGALTTVYLAIYLPEDWQSKYRVIYELEDNKNQTNSDFFKYTDSITVNPKKYLTNSLTTKAIEDNLNNRNYIIDCAREQISAWAHGIKIPQVGEGSNADLEDLINRENRMSIAVQDKIEAKARYDIVHKKGKFETKYNKIDGKDYDLDFDISAEYDSTGEYIIWTMAARHHQDSNQILRFKIDPHEGLEKEPPVDQITVSPYRYMEWIYNPEDNPNISGYEPGINDNGFHNRVNIWTHPQEGGELPVPPNEWVILKYRTKITNPNLKQYSLGAQAEYSWAGVNSSVTRSKAVDCYIEGKSIDLSVELPYYDVNKNAPDLNIQVKAANNGDPYRVYAETKASKNSNHNGARAVIIPNLPRFDSEGKRIAYKLEVQENGGPKSYSHQVDTNGDIFSIEAEDKSYVTPTLPGGKFSEAKTDFPILPGYQYQGDLTDIKVEGTYIEDGDAIVWTVTAQQNKGDNEDLYLKFATFPGHAVPKIATDNFILSSPKPYDKTSFSFYDEYNNDLGQNLTWLNGYLKIPGTKKGVPYTFRILTSITDEQAESYDFMVKGSFNWNWPYLFGEYNKVVRLEGKHYNPSIKFHYRSATPTGAEYEAEKLNVAKNIQPIIRDDSGEYAATFHYNEKDSTFRLDSTLPRFDKEGRKIYYYIDFDRDNPALKDYDFVSGLRHIGRYNYEITAYKKSEAYPEYKGDEPIWGVTSVDPIEFKFSEDVARDYNNPRLPSGFFGMFAKLSGTFRVPDTARRGDKFTLKLPADFNIKAGSDFDIYDPETRQSIASVAINPETNSLEFTLTDYVDTHEGVTGRFEMGPILSSIWDSYNSYVNKKFVYESQYLPLNQVGFIHSRGSADYPRNYYGDDETGTRDIVFKEELDEGSDYLTYAIGLNRGNSRRANILERVEEIFEESEAGPWYLYGGKDAAPEDNIKIYSLPSIDEAGADRRYLTDQNLIWPTNNTDMDFAINLKMKSDKKGFEVSIKRRDPRNPVGPIVMLVKAQKQHFFSSRPQKNTVKVYDFKTYTASSSRYATYGSGSGSGVTRELPTGRIEVIKVDLTNNKLRLPNAKFNLYKQGNYRPNDLEAGKIATLTTNSEGIARYEKLLPIGDYQLVEIEAPEGYQKLREPIDIHLKGTASYQKVYVSNTRDTGISLVKISELPKGVSVNDGQYQPLYGAVYQLHKANGDAIGEPVTTDYNGVASWNNITESGLYYAEEIAPPPGFVLPDASIDEKTTQNNTWKQRKVWFDVKVENGEALSEVQYAQNSSDDATIQIYKVESGFAESNVAYQGLSGAVFGIFETSDFDEITQKIKPEAKPFQIQRSGSTGLVVFSRLSADRDYYVKELSSPAGYNIKEEILKLRSGSRMSVVTFSAANDKAQGDRKLTVVKKDATNTDVYLPQAYFELRRADNKKLIRTAVTDNNGQFILDKLEPTKYLLQEVQAPEGYKTGLTLEGNNAETQDDGSLLIDLTGSNQAISLSVLNQPNDPPNVPKGSLKIIKQELGNQQPLSGISFQLISEDGSYDRTETTNKQGVIEFNELPLGTYTLIEKNFPQGFKKVLLDSETVDDNTINRKDSDRINVEIISEEQKVLEVYNLRKKAILNLIKKARLSSETDAQAHPLAGVEFSLKELGTDKNIVKQISNQSGELSFENLLVGKSYEIWESNSPEGYSTQPLVFHEEGSLSSIEKMANGHFKIIVKDDTNSSNDPIILNYVAIDEKLETPKLRLKIQKNDIESGAALAGVGFKLQNSNVSEVVFEAKTDSEGKLEFDNLPAGTYTLEELEPATGYDNKLLDCKLVDDKNRSVDIQQTGNKISFTLTADSEIKNYSLVIKNIKRPDQGIPSVGGPGYYIIRFIALIIIALAIYMLVTKKRHR